MADKLKETLDIYSNIWLDIKNGGLTKELPEVDKDALLKELVDDINKAFSKQSGKDALKKQLETFHLAANQAHGLRSLTNITAHPLTTLRGFRNVGK